MTDSMTDITAAVDTLLSHDDLETTTMETIREETSVEPGPATASERSGADSESLDLLALLGRTHALVVLKAFAMSNGPLRFSELEEELAISPSTLSARLSEFVDAGLLDREAHDEIPPRVEYRTTEQADSLVPLFVYLHLWADRYGYEA